VSTCSVTSSRDSGPDELFAEVGRALADAVAAAVGPWVTARVHEVLGAWRAAGGDAAGADGAVVAGGAGGGAGGAGDAGEAGDAGDAGDDGDRLILARADDAGRKAADELRTSLRALAALDVDAQQVTPLQLVRDAVAYPTAVLVQAGVPPVVRDDFAEERFPDDLYGLSPSSLRALGPEVAELGLAWGAAKAAAHRARHRT